MTKDKTISAASNFRCKEAKKKHYSKKKKTFLKSKLSTLTDEERKEYLSDASDNILSCSQDVQDRYVVSEIALKAMNECPDRWFTFINKRDETVTIDLKVINVPGTILAKGGTQEDVDDAQEIKKKILQPLMNNAASSKKSFLDAYTKEKDASVPPQLWNKVIQLFAELNGVEDIKKIVLQKYNISLTYSELYKFAIKNKAEIDAKKATFLASSDQYKIATDAGRLQILNNILTDLYLKYEYYIKSEADSRSGKALIFSREIRNILEQARKEVKGNELKLTVDGKIDITATLHGQENIDKVMRTLPVNAIVLGIVAAKARINPVILIHQLATSYYKDFNGFNNNILGRDKIQLPGDFIRGANWKEIEENNKRFIGEIQEIKVENDSPKEIREKESTIDRLKDLRKKAEELSRQ